MSTWPETAQIMGKVNEINVRLLTLRKVDLKSYTEGPVVELGVHNSKETISRVEHFYLGT